MLLTSAQIKSFELRQNFFLYPGWMHLFTCVLGPKHTVSTGCLTSTVCIHQMPYLNSLHLLDALPQQSASTGCLTSTVFIHQMPYLNSLHPSDAFPSQSLHQAVSSVHHQLHVLRLLLQLFLLGQFLFIWHLQFLHLGFQLHQENLKLLHTVKHIPASCCTRIFFF